MKKERRELQPERESISVAGSSGNATLDCRIIRKSSGSSRFADAELMLHSGKKAVKEGKKPETKTIQSFTFKELAEKCKEWVKGRQSSAIVKICNIDRLLDGYDAIVTEDAFRIAK